MDWCSINNDYLNFLRDNGDDRIPYSEYFSSDGEKRFKPFFTPLFTVGDLVYTTQITSPKARHYRMKNSQDFIKILKDEEDKRSLDDTLFGVVNLNYMFPVPKEFITTIKYGDLENYRDFKDEKEKSEYIDLLKKELKKIKSSSLEVKAVKVYELKEKAPDSMIAQRCLDFKKLEEVAKKFKKEK